MAAPVGPKKVHRFTKFNQRAKLGEKKINVFLQAGA